MLPMHPFEQAAVVPPAASPRRARRERRRGVAMLLIIVAIGVGTVLASAALTSRDNSPAIGANAATAASAVWPASAGVQFALAAMQSNDGAAALSSGSILSNYSLAGGTVSVTATNPKGQPLQPTDREVIITSTARVGAMTYSEQRRVSLVRPTPVDQAIDPYLGEFAVFAQSSLTIEDGAVIKTFPLSPEAGTLMPVKIGTGFASSASLSVGGNARLVGVSYYPDATASPTLKSETGLAAFAGGQALALDVPAVPEVLPSGFTGLVQVTLLNLVPSALNILGQPVITLLNGGGYKNLRVRGGAEVVLDQAKGGYYVFSQLDVDTNGVLRIKGKVQVKVMGAMNILSGGAIELTDAGSEVVFLTGGDVKLDNSGVGVARVVARNAARTPDSLTGYVCPDRVRVVALGTASGGAANPKIDVGHSAIVVACIHSPLATADVSTASGIIGRITASSLRLRSGTSILYDPVLDTRVGFTADYGPLYTNGTPMPEAITAISAYVPALGAVVNTTSLRTIVKAKLSGKNLWCVDNTAAPILAEDPIDPAATTTTPRNRSRFIHRPLPIAAKQLEG